MLPLITHIHEMMRWSPLCIIEALKAGVLPMLIHLYDAMDKSPDPKCREPKMIEFVDQASATIVGVIARYLHRYRVYQLVLQSLQSLQRDNVLSFMIPTHHFYETWSQFVQGVEGLQFAHRHADAKPIALQCRNTNVSFPRSLYPEMENSQQSSPVIVLIFR